MLGRSLQARLTAWPYDNDAHVPYVGPVWLSQIPIISTHLQIHFGEQGLPFAPVVELVHLVSSCNDGALNDMECFTREKFGADTTYVLGVVDSRHNPPMMNTKFRVTPRHEGHIIMLMADKYVDGIGGYSFEAGFTWLYVDCCDQVEIWDVKI